MTSVGVIVIAGAVCGALDLISASALFKLRGGSFVRLLQFIGSGVFGESAFKGGKRTATVGFLFRFFIAFTAAGVYYAASRSLTILVSHAFVCGILYSTLIHLSMSIIVIPLSAAPKRKFSVSFFLSQLAVHMFVVGLSISLVVRHFS